MRPCTYLDRQRRERCTECGITIDLCTCVDTNESAHQRLWSHDGKMTKIITNELLSARERFPRNRHMLAALVEEVGELAQAMIEHDRAEGKTANEVFRESVQVAAMAIRLATEGDEAFAYDPFAVFGE